MKSRIEDYKIVKEQLGETLESVSFSFWMDDLLKKNYTDANEPADNEDIKWLMLMSYQRGYAKAVEDNAIPEFDEYYESDAYFLKLQQDSIAAFKSKYKNGCNIEIPVPDSSCPEDWENHDDND